MSRSPEAMTWQVASTRVTGKHPDPSRCEDVVVLSSVLCAVVDGATDKSGLDYQRAGTTVSSGRFAALTLADALEALDPTVDPFSAVRLLSATLDAALREQRPGLAAHERPAASLVVANALRGELWWVGDCRFALRYPSGRIRQTAPVKEVDAVTTRMRVTHLAALAAAGRPWDPASGTPDPGRAVILPLLELQGALANTSGPLGYGVINGTTVPDMYVGVEPVDQVTDVVLASDGYPDLAPEGRLSLAAAETRLSDCLRTDPACVGPLAGTKALGGGMASFDDRAWVHVRPRRAGRTGVALSASSSR